MREHRRGISLIRSRHESLRALDLSIAAMNGVRRALAPGHRVLDAGGAGAAGRLALRDGVQRVVVLQTSDTPAPMPGAPNDSAGDRLSFAGVEQLAALADQGERFDVVLGPMPKTGLALDLRYGAKLDALAQRVGTARCAVVPNGIRYSAQLVEWDGAARLEADVAALAHELEARYAVDLEPPMSDTHASPVSHAAGVPAGQLRALDEPMPFLTCRPGAHANDANADANADAGSGDASEAVPPTHVVLTAARAGRADGVVWIQELIHDGIVIGRAHGCEWLDARVDLGAGERVEVAVAGFARAAPFDDDQAALRHAPVARGTAHGAPLVFWLTGISGAGKTTIATRFSQQADTLGWPVTVLDGDALRSGLNADLGFSDAARAENVRRIAEVAALMADTGRIVVVSCISPKQSFRDAARAIVGAGRFVEVFVDAPAAVAEARDPKGLYRRARAGLIASFTSIDSGYEAPRHPQLHLDTTVLDVESAVGLLCRHYDAFLRPVATVGDVSAVAV